MAIYKAVQDVTKVVTQSYWEEFDTDNQDQWESLKSRAENCSGEDLSSFPEEAPSDPNIWFELFQKVYHLEYENEDEEDWVSERKGTTEYCFELRDHNDNAIGFA
jgi:hypothetical protein